MAIHRAFLKLHFWAVTSMLLFAIPARGQGPGLLSAEFESELAGVKTENAILRDKVQRLEDQQALMLEMMKDFQQRLGISPTADFALAGAEPTSLLASSTLPALDPVPAATPQSASVKPPPAEEPDSLMDRLGDKYNDGFILVETSDASRFPFRMRFNALTQFRYTNTRASNDSFTDHLGVVRTVAQRNDFSINRNMIQINGYVFSKRMQYNLIAWASNSLATVIEGGTIGFQFNKGLTLQAGYWGIPGSRSLSYTFPYFIQPERSLADNFFRPGFTQGVWATGEPVKGLNYEAFVGNGLNTLTIPTTKIDTTLMYSGSVWWEPLGRFGPNNRARNMYDDFYGHEKPAIRVGGGYTKARENRFSNLDQRNPENTSMYNSDGVLTFATGAFAPGVTLEYATYRMWAIDGGFKWKGLSLNGQYYFRLLNDFVADGPLPLDSTFDHGFEFSAAHFFIPRKLELYGRSSHVFGQFGNSYEFAPGIKFYPFQDHRVWLTGEALRMVRSPVGGILTPYTGGMTGWAPMGQLMFNF